MFKKADLITDSNLILDIIEEAILLEVNRKELKKNLVDELVLLKIEIKILTWTWSNTSSFEC